MQLLPFIYSVSYSFLKKHWPFNSTASLSTASLSDESVNIDVGINQFIEIDPSTLKITALFLLDDTKSVIKNDLH